MSVFSRSLRDENQDDWMLFVGACVGKENQKTFQLHNIDPIHLVRTIFSPDDVLLLRSFIENMKRDGIKHVLRYRNENMVLSEDQKQILN